MSDRDVAMDRSGIKTGNICQESKEDLNAKSFRVQMRNSVKVEDEKVLPPADGRSSATLSSKREVSVDEWMEKPQKMNLDILDTEKFAAIVKQKHGGKESPNVPKKLSPTPPHSSMVKPEDDRRRSSSDRRKPDRVELQLSSRGNDRDRDGRYNRDNRRDRRRYVSFYSCLVYLFLVIVYSQLFLHLRRSFSQLGKYSRSNCLATIFKYFLWNL